MSLGELSERAVERFASAVWVLGFAPMFALGFLLLGPDPMRRAFWRRIDETLREEAAR